MLRSPATQRGFLLITAVVLIVTVGLLAAVITFLTTGNVLTSASHANSAKALFIAESGLERGIRAQLSPVLAERVACTAVTGDVNLTSIALGEGRFTLTGGTAFYPNNANNTLKAGIGAADTVIPLNDLTGFAATGGRVLIDREAIDYSGISSDTAVCGGAASTPCLVGAQRGRDGTRAIAHVINARVGQYQCDMTSRGGVPDLSASSARRTLTQGIQLQEGWVVGNRERDIANNFTMGRWNRPTETQWNAAFLAGNNNTRADLNAISMSSYADGWAVGNSRNGNFILLRFNPSTGWAVQTVAPTPAGDDQNLNGVSCVSMNDCWAVGDRRNGTCGGGNRLHTILRWNGAWTVLTTATVPSVPACSANNQTLNDVFAVSASEVWAVGNRYTGGCGGGTRRPTIMRWITGGNWTLLTNATAPSVPNCGTNRDLNALYMLDTDGDADADDGWAVGVRDSGAINGWTFFRWSAAANSWSRIAVTTAGTGALDLNSVYMLSTTDGWAVGAGGVILRWNNPTVGTWNINAAPGAVTALSLNAVACFTAEDCWAVGNSLNAGTDPPVMLHWNGSGWATVAAPAGFDEHLNALSLIGARTKPRTAWREVFP